MENFKEYYKNILIQKLMGEDLQTPARAAEMETQIKRAEDDLEARLEPAASTGNMGGIGASARRISDLRRKDAEEKGDTRTVYSRGGRPSPVRQGRTMRGGIGPGGEVVQPTRIP
jgi:hypothetical protein